MLPSNVTTFHPNKFLVHFVFDDVLCLFCCVFPVSCFIKIAIFHLNATLHSHTHDTDSSFIFVTDCTILARLRCSSCVSLSPPPFTMPWTWDGTWRKYTESLLVLFCMRHAMSIALKYQIDFYQINIKIQNKKQRKCN